VKKILLVVLALVAVGLVTYIIWASTGRDLPLPAADSNFRAVTTWGVDSGRGNLVGIQPYLLPPDYSSETAFLAKMDGYFREAKKRHVLTPKSIVVLPEYVGTWLVAANEKRRVYAAKTAGEALQTVVLSHLVDFFKAKLTAPDSVADPTTDAVFRMKAPGMAGIYGRVFSKIARTYGVTVVAGSILLPEPGMTNGQLIIGEGRLQNVSAVFRPDGSLAGLVRKAFPTREEQQFLCAASSADNPVFDTPAGRLGVLVCADAWFPQAYAALKTKGATLLAVPSYSMLNDAWLLPWNGYSGFPTPADARADVGKIREGEAWQRYTMPTRAPREAGIRRGINVFLRGKLWDLGADGGTIMLRDSARLGPMVNAATLSVVWL
jgi:predicted amidohydrolase